MKRVGDVGYKLLIDILEHITMKYIVYTEDSFVSKILA